MFEHILLLKLENSKNFDLLKKGFEELKIAIKQIVDLEFKVNCYKRETNFDVFVKITFKRKSDFENYLVNEHHVEFVENYVDKLVDKKVAIDYLS